MYGVTEDGYSVCCHVHGFSPYFYVSLPDKFTHQHCGEFKQALNQAVLKDMKSNRDSVSEPVLMVELVYKINMYGYRGEDKTPHAKITVSVPRLVFLQKVAIEYHFHTIYNNCLIIFLCTHTGKLHQQKDY
jgi:DNA polymerase delta subunit 1